jgi:hypothetical protein
MSYAPTAILKSDIEKAPALPGLFVHREDKKHNSFHWTNLAASHLE